MRCKAGNVAVGSTPGETWKILALQIGINAFVDSGRSQNLAVRVVPETGVLDPLTAQSLHEILFDRGRAAVGPFNDELAALGNDACELAKRVNELLNVVEMANDWWEEGTTADRRITRARSLVAAAAAEEKKGKTGYWVLGGLALATVIGAVVFWPRKRRR